MHPVQLKMARAALDLSIDQLASRAGLSHMDVVALEGGGAAGSEAEAKARVTLEACGIAWIDDNGVRFTGPAAADATIPVDALNSYNDE